jgi:hypothetical protein
VKTDVTNRFSHCPLPFLQVLKVGKKITTETPLQSIRNAVTPVKRRYGRETPLRPQKIQIHFSDIKIANEYLLAGESESNQFVLFFNFSTISSSIPSSISFASFSNL